MRACSLAAGFFVLLAASTPAPAAELPNLERGRLLYENHCQVCHTPDIHRRANRLPLNAAEVREIVRHWQEAEKLSWREQDIEDVVHFLRQTRYRF